MKKPPDNPLRACDVLNWGYLVEISEKPDKTTRDRKQAFRGFAYAFTSTADENIRDQMLMEFIRNGTDNQSRKSSEDFLRVLAEEFRSDRNTLRQFAKENGVRLLTDWWLARLDPTFGNP